MDCRPLHGAFIINHYAPNNRKAVVPKGLDVYDLGWVRGKFGQKNPVAYSYDHKDKGWIKVSKK